MLPDQAIVQNAATESRKRPAAAAEKTRERSDSGIVGKSPDKISLITKRTYRFCGAEERGRKGMERWSTLGMAECGRAARKLDSCFGHTAVICERTGMQPAHGFRIQFVRQMARFTLYKDTTLVAQKCGVTLGTRDVQAQPKIARTTNFNPAHHLHIRQQAW